MPIQPLTTLSIDDDAYPDDSQVELGFEPDFYSFFNESTTAADVIQFSFDGQITHGKLVPGTPIAAMSWETKGRRVWFRRATAGAAVAVSVMAGSRA